GEIQQQKRLQDCQRAPDSLDSTHCRKSGFEIMAEIFRVLYVIAGVVLLFGAAVFVHEFGHFRVARLRGLKVEGFSIGFGPKILSWTRDGIEYSWRWIPAGGFVKLPQMITSEALEGANAAAEKIPPAPPWSKILGPVAGPIM